MVRTLIVSSCTADKRFDAGLKASGLSELTAGDFYYKNTGKIVALRNGIRLYLSKQCRTTD